MRISWNSCIRSLTCTAKFWRRSWLIILSDFNGWTEERAIELGRQVLRDNVDLTFGAPDSVSIEDTHVIDTVEIVPEESGQAQQATLGEEASSASSAALTAGAIGTVEINDTVEMEPGEVSPNELSFGAMDLSNVSGVQEIVQTDFAQPPVAEEIRRRGNRSAS